MTNLTLLRRKFTHSERAIRSMILVAGIILFADIAIAATYFSPSYWPKFFGYIVAIIFTVPWVFFLFQRRAWARIGLVLATSIFTATGFTISAFILSATGLHRFELYLAFQDQFFVLIFCATPINAFVTAYFMQKHLETFFAAKPSKNPEEAPTFLPDASLGDRFDAACIDKGIPLLALLLPLVALYSEDADLSLLALGVSAIVRLLSAVVGIISLFLIYFRSQTLGKWMFDIQVVDAKTGHRIGFWRYIINRNLVGETFFGITFLTFLFLGFVAGSIIFLLYFVVDSLFIFGSKRQTIHDVIAKTRVVKLPETI